MLLLPIPKHLKFLKFLKFLSITLKEWVLVQLNSLLHVKIFPFQHPIYLLRTIFLSIQISFFFINDNH